MSNCVFAHAAYGVILPDKDQEIINGVLEAYRSNCEPAELADPGDDDDVDLLDNGALIDFLVNSDDPATADLMTRLHGTYGASASAGLIYTGDADEHMGGCAADSELWIYGYGIMQFPHVRVPQTFEHFAQWHTWVTGEV